MASILMVLACAVPIVMAQGASITAENNIPTWGADSAMQLSLSSEVGNVVPLTYTVMPSTQSLGLNQSDLARGAIRIEGTMIAADASNYRSIQADDQIAYLSCDVPEFQGEGFVSPDMMLNTLMENTPKAIVLYSTVGNWCLLSGSDLPFESIFTMADAGDAVQALSILNGTNEVDVIRVSITGNTTVDGVVSANGQNGNNSAVAMSILYSITGLITLLFLVIIATGAIRAHRYPERYGPRSGYGGRPRQSRAKGLARAVLETIPIVKFGSPQPAKPDPAMELESASIERTDDRPADRPVTPRDAERRRESTPVQVQTQTHAQPAAPKATPTTNADGGSQAEEDLGCSICTDDFTVGEDVRVLPCSHKFHPNCIDPWLVNVSGTCPLCRMDLRPRNADGSSKVAEEDSTLPPPLEMDGHESDSSSTTQRRRMSRLFDLNRLRHASAEERIEVLRQYRTEQRGQNPSSDAEVDDRSRRAKLADKLRDKFRIRTRPQSPAMSRPGGDS